MTTITEPGPQLTKGEAVQKFREHWRYIAGELESGGTDWNPVTLKRNMLQPEGRTRHIVNWCWLCEYARQRVEELELETDDWGGLWCARFCPIKWASVMGEATCLSALYGKFTRMLEFNASKKIMRDAAQLARAISELPEREVD